MPQSRSPRATTKAAVQPSQTDAGTRRGLRPRASALAVADTTACQIVGAHLHAHAIAQQNADAELAHLATRIGQQLVAVVELDLELGVRQSIDNGPIHLDRVVFRQRRNGTVSGARGPGLAVATPCGTSGAALRLEAIRTVDGLISAGLERHARLAVAAGASGHEHLAAGCRAVATAGVCGGPERVSALCLALCAA